jgi:hypothetical protein
MRRDITIVVVTEGGRYEAGNGKIQLIGDQKGKWVSWRVVNQTPTPIHVKIHKFSPSPCPVEKGHFNNCAYDSKAAGDPPIPAAGGTRDNFRTIKGKLTQHTGLYTYEFFVRNHTTGAGNAVDPELQIDDFGLVDQLKPVLITVGLIGALAYLYRRFRS